MSLPKPLGRVPLIRMTTWGISEVTLAKSIQSSRAMCDFIVVLYPILMMASSKAKASMVKEYVMSSVERSRTAAPHDVKLVFCVPGKQLALKGF